MNLRLDNEHDELLDALAQQEHRTKTEVVKLAIEDRASRADKSTRTRAIFQRILEEDADLLNALSK